MCLVTHSLFAHLQGQLLASVNNKLEALGLPRGGSSLSRNQQFLAAHGISSGAPAGAHVVKDQHQQSLDSAASAWSQAADDSADMALTIKAKAIAESPQASDQARIANDTRPDNSDSRAAAARVQQGRRQPNAFSAHAKSHALQSSGPASMDAQTLDSNTADYTLFGSLSQPLSPEPQISEPSTLTPQPQACMAQPQTLRAQTQTLSAQSLLPPPEQVCNAALSTDSSALSHCNTELQSLPSASVPAAAEATVEGPGAIAVQTPSGMQTAQTDAAKLASPLNAAEGEITLQFAPSYSTAQQGVEGLAHISRIDSSAGASSNRSCLESSQHASIINEQGSWVVMQPGRTSLSVSQPLESAAAVAVTSPALAVMQGPAAPGVMPHSSSSSIACRSEAGEEGNVHIRSKASVEAGKQVDVEAVAEVGVSSRRTADIKGSQAADTSAGFGDSAAWPENTVENATAQVDQKQASSTVGPPTGIVKAFDFTSSIDGRDLQRSLMVSESRTGRLQGSFCTNLDYSRLWHKLHVCDRLCSAPFGPDVLCHAL